MICFAEEQDLLIGFISFVWGLKQQFKKFGFFLKSILENGFLKFFKGKIKKTVRCYLRRGIVK